MDILAFILSTLGTVCICIPPILKGKNMKLILLFVFSANLLVALSYLCTGGFNGAASCFVGAATSIINYFYDKNEKELPKWLVGVYAAAFIAVNLLVFKSVFDLVAMVASLTFIGCIGQKNGAKYRLWTLANVILWIAYDLICASYGPLSTHVIQLGFVVTGIFIHDIKKSLSK